MVSREILQDQLSYDGIGDYIVTVSWRCQNFQPQSAVNINSAATNYDA